MKGISDVSFDGLGQGDDGDRPSFGPVRSVVTPAIDSAQWWREAVVYQIYPRSFQDSNEDGVGDLVGITRRLPYLSWLGVDAIWISPFYSSPQRDFGYDITDHTDVDPMFGELADFDQMLTEAHRLGLRILLDFVPNHTSIDHPWFVESRTSAHSSLRDWYIWRDPAPDGGAPNNWRSVTGGSAWTLDGTSGQYYLHSFLPTQPDLNWRNGAVAETMQSIMRFWLDRGADGFRVDMVDYLVKDEHFRDEATDATGRYDPATARHHLNQPETLEVLRQLRGVSNAYTPPRALVGEVEYRLPLTRLASYYGADDMLHLPINFWLMFLDWNADGLRRFIQEYENSLPLSSWPNWVLSSHDISRPATRLGTEQARAALVLLLTLRGTPFLYYGDELGLTDVHVPSEHVVDPWGLIDPGAGRDPVRTPMPWTDELHAGFCSPTAQPWLPVGEHHRHRQNVARQQQDPHSVLTLTRSVLALRRERASLRSGTCTAEAASDDSVLRYWREQGEDRILVLINLSDQPRIVTIGEQPQELLLSTHRRQVPPILHDSLELKSHEACILSLGEQHGQPRDP